MIREREVAAVGKVVAHLCLTLIVKELKINVEQGRVVTILNTNQTLYILFGVVLSKTNDGIGDT